MFELKSLRVAKSLSCLFSRLHAPSIAFNLAFTLHCIVPRPKPVLTPGERLRLLTLIVDAEIGVDRAAKIEGINRNAAREWAKKLEIKQEPGPKTIGERACTDCKERKPLALFARNGAMVDGYAYRCLGCDARRNNRLMKLKDAGNYDD